MGTDIHTYAERRVADVWEKMPIEPPFCWRDYGMFAFLADVRNYSCVTPVSHLRGVPPDTAEPEFFEEYHSCTWVSVAELLAVNYDAPFEDRRVTRQTGPNSWSGAVIANVGEGTLTTLRGFLSPAFFDDLRRITEAGAERVVMGFDS